MHPEDVGREDRRAVRDLSCQAILGHLVDPAHEASCPAGAPEDLQLPGRRAAVVADWEALGGAAPAAAAAAEAVVALVAAVVAVELAASVAVVEA